MGRASDQQQPLAGVQAPLMASSEPDDFLTIPVAARFVREEVADHLGRPREALEAATGTVVWEWIIFSNPFGETPPSGAFPLNLRFPGQYYDWETGLHYNYFRDYEPQTGRYVQIDPIGLEGGLSLYSYTSANPLFFVDTLGLFNMIATEVPDYNHGYRYTYSFTFKTCVMDVVGKGATAKARIARGLSRARKIFPDRRAGDVDIDGWRLRCQCQNHDRELSQVLSRTRGLNREQADIALDLLRRELEKLERQDDCTECSEAYDWHSIRSNAEGRAFPSLHRLARGR